MEINILDTSYAHQGHQYEFFKLPCNFFLVQSSHPSRIPSWNINGRPLRDNVKVISLGRLRRVLSKPPDVIIHRVNSRPYFYRPFIKNGTKVIAVMQTTTPYKLPSFITHVVWNCKKTMMDNKNSMRSGLSHHYIPHGFSSDEFLHMNKKRDKDVMIIANDFVERTEFLNYNLWHNMSKEFDNHFHVWGHQRAYKPKNAHILSRGMSKAQVQLKDLDMTVRMSKSIENLVNVYNSYKVYFNTTSHSALPRGRGEAMMCGTPLVTTDNYDISDYLVNKKDCILSNNYDELKKGIRDILNDEDCRNFYSTAARNAAIKHFGIDSYIEKWMKVINS